MSVLTLNQRRNGYPSAWSAYEPQSSLRDQMVAWQEELDWTVYVAYGLAPDCELIPLSNVGRMASNHRPFALRLAAGDADGTDHDSIGSKPWDRAQVETGAEYPRHVRERTLARLSLDSASPQLAMLEAPEHKRKWEPTTFDADLKTFCSLGSRVKSNGSCLNVVAPLLRTSWRVRYRIRHVLGRRGAL